MKKLYWIDDSHDNQRLPKGAAKRRIEGGLGVLLAPDHPIKNRAEFVDLLLSMKPEKTCGVIMDYQLTDVGEKKQMAFGTTWAAEIRAKHPSIPVVGISHCLEKHIPKFQLESFLAFFPRKQLTDINPRIDDLRALLSGYHSVYKLYQSHEKKPGADLMLELLSPPRDVAELLHSAIPSGLRGPWDKETPHIAGRWIWHELQGMPGFLLDDIGLATHLGLNLAGLARVVGRFKHARFKGAFASDERPRWWTAAIRSIVDSLVGAVTVGQVSRARMELLKAVNVKRSDVGGLISRPFGRKSSDQVPDCVAYKDDELEEDDRVQALMEDTKIDDRDANLAFGFIPRRMYSPQQME